MESIPTDELYTGAEVISVGPKMKFGTEERSFRREVPAWTMAVSLGDRRSRGTTRVTIWQAEEPAVAEGQFVRFAGVQVGASDAGKVFVTAETWGLKK